MDKKETNVSLVYMTPLWLIANGIRYSHDNHHLSDTDKSKIDNCKDWREAVEIIGDKDYDLINRVAFHMFHLSVTEHSLLVFKVLNPDLEQKLKSICFVRYEQNNPNNNHLYSMNLRTLYENRHSFPELIEQIKNLGFNKVYSLLTN